MNKVTVIIPNKNYNHYLDSAVESVLEQTIPCEIIVVDYGSDQKLSYFIESNTHTISFLGNLNQARNKGVSLADTEYILTLDADDILEPDFLDKTLSKIQEKVIVSTGCMYFGDENYTWMPDIKNFEEYNQILNCSLFQKNLWNEIGGWDEKMDGYEDWDFWYRATKKGYRVEVIREPLVNIRVHSDSRNVEAIKNHEELKNYIISK